MRALIDRHHADLYYAMQKLLEDGLGIELYTPIGYAWWEEGYWRFGESLGIDPSGAGPDRLARQYLMGFDEQIIDGCHPDRPIRGVFLSDAVDMEWDFVIATVQENQSGFARFARERGAQYVLQVGNTRQYIDWSLDPLAIVSSEMPIEGRGVRIHQPFDHDTTFRFREPRSLYSLTSFVNLAPLVPECAWAYDGLAKFLPHHQVNQYGHETPGGFLSPVSKVAETMAASGWGLHVKTTGDGFGHVIHGWAAVGRPLVGFASYYRGQMAEHLWRDGETSIDLDRHSLREAADLIEEISADPGRHDEMCRAIRAEFDTIDWAAEQRAVAGLLGVAVAA